jgi:uncharacterized protein
MNPTRVMFFPPWMGVLFFILFLPKAGAETVSNLYEAEVPVSGQTSEARAQGIREAFAAVLVKVSGDRSLVNNPDLSGLLNRASSLIQQYRYKSLPSRSGTAGAEYPDRLLWARFDARAVNRLLRESSIPVWGETRPSLLVWMGQETGTRRELISPERETSFKSELSQVAGARGIPLIWPLMDIEDQNAVQVSDLWGGFEEDIRSASDRYLPDVILVGRLSNLGRGGWRGEWLLYLPDKVNRWQTLASTREALASEGLQQAIDALALRYAPQQVSQGTMHLKLQVYGVSRLADYALIQDYLRTLAMIEQVDLLSADAEKIDFLLRVNGNRESLVRGIQLGAVLEPVVIQASPDPNAPEQNQAIEGDVLTYRLR